MRSQPPLDKSAKGRERRAPPPPLLSGGRAGQMVPWPTWLRQHVLIAFPLFLIKASALVLAGRRLPDPNINRPWLLCHSCLRLRDGGAPGPLPVPPWAGNDVAAAPPLPPEPEQGSTLGIQDSFHPG